jgi:hypothetical protein
MVKPKRSPKRKRLETREDSIMTSVVLPRDLHRQIGQAALDLNWSLAEVMRAAVTEWLIRNNRLGDGKRQS